MWKGLHLKMNSRRNINLALQIEHLPRLSFCLIWSQMYRFDSFSPLSSTLVQLQKVAVYVF